MFSINQKVLYGSQGVCKIQEIIRKNFGADERDYYVLVGVYRTLSTVYVPLDSPVLCAKMRTLPQKDELLDILNSPAENLIAWEENKYTRHEKFVQILEKGTDSEVIALVHLLQNKNKELLAIGKHLHINDERILQESQRLIKEEIACVFELPLEKADEFINQNTCVIL